MKKFLIIIFIIIAVILTWALVGSAIFMKLTKTPRYYNVYNVIEDTATADRIDMDVSFYLDSTLPDINFDFNLVKIPYDDDNAIKYTVDTFLGPIRYYEINNKIYEEDNENFLYTDVPENLTNFLLGCAYLYGAGYEITTTELEDETMYTIDIPDEEIDKLIDIYGGTLNDMNIIFYDSTITVTAQENRLKKIEIDGTAKYTILDKMDLRGDFTIDATINGINDQVETFKVPKIFL